MRCAICNTLLEQSMIIFDKKRNRFLDCPDCRKQSKVYPDYRIITNEEDKLGIDACDTLLKPSDTE